MKKIAVHFWILLLVCAAAGQAQGKDPAYRVGPRDQISVHVDEDEKLNGDRRVSEAGTINLSLIGDVQVAGKTTGEIALTVKKLLEAKYMQRASVDVQVTEFRSRPISVIGAVKSRGNLGFSGHWTLLEAITAAGGLSETHGNVVYILRRADNGLSDQVTIDLNDLLVRGDPAAQHPDLRQRPDQRPGHGRGDRLLPRRGGQARRARLQEQRADHRAHRHRPRRRADRPRVEQDPDQAGGQRRRPPRAQRRLQEDPRRQGSRTSISGRAT